MPEKITTAEQRAQFLDKFDNFLFDCDGVLWVGKEVVPGINSAMAEIRKRGKRAFFVTNNSTKSRDSFVEKFAGFGIDAKVEEFFTSAFATATYLKNVVKFPADKKVYIVGMSGIKEELAAVGIRSFGAGEDSGLLDDEPVPDDPEVGAVVFGLDTQINFKKYQKAFAYLYRNPDCHFILTNSDTTFPNHGTIMPGCGSMVMPLITALNRQPDVILGKPAQNMMQAIFAQYDLDPKRTCMIGDRLDTDIDFGRQGGLETLRHKRRRAVIARKQDSAHLLR
ncbi:HAD-like domain-containing protein [Radiomyces spectabilis]|uniref:HAD-like domain-containing protein n=1 Tax=Radiomyces spectabilis TaxID=64574 RepID=UPI00221EF068|nr:HAD-like domain-containing protein [Radiomyces spectabilis]KAI8390862.1 HAD-like domain-containing protein [Radiomyces spectabilis]